ncbi:unnamed protein product [Prunus brigantina]
MGISLTLKLIDKLDTITEMSAIRWKDIPFSTRFGPSSFDILHGHSRATMFLIANNTAQAILSSFFFKYAC